MDRRGRMRAHRRPPRRNPADRGEGHRRDGGAWRSGVYSRRSPLPTPVRGPGSPHRRARIGDRMTTIYVRHDVTTSAEVNALALDEDQRENGAIVLYEGSTCYWSINWATRNEIPGRWYDNSRDGLQLVDGDEVTVLVPIEAEKETREHPTRDEE